MAAAATGKAVRRAALPMPDNRPKVKAIYGNSISPAGI
jgi:hypothetical protein